MASMASKSGINIQMSTNGINDRVKNMLGNGLKLTDLKSRQQLTGIENLKKKVQEGTAPSHQKLHIRRQNLKDGQPEQLDKNLSDLKSQLRKIS
jgi:hypothetical protein